MWTGRFFWTNLFGSLTREQACFCLSKYIVQILSFDKFVCLCVCLCLMAWLFAKMINLSKSDVSPTQM